MAITHGVAFLAVENDQTRNPFRRNTNIILFPWDFQPKINPGQQAKFRGEGGRERSENGIALPRSEAPSH